MKLLMLMIGGACFLVGIVGLYESARWANSCDSRYSDFALGAFLLLLGVLAFHTAADL